MADTANVPSPSSRQRLPRRALGRTGLQVSRLGLTALAVSSGGRPREGLGPDAVERAFHEDGVNTFLVHFMMPNLCEGVRRLIRAGHRDELVIVSEVGFPFAGSVRRGLEKHLRLLETDHLDAWLVGWTRSRWYLRDAVWSELVRLREAGKTRVVGISSHDRPLATELARTLPLDVLMIRYNAAHRGAEREVFEPLAALGDRRPGIIAYTATRWRMLLAPLPDRGFPEPMSAGDCYRFVLSHPLVDTVWCAAQSPQELRQDLDAVLAGPLEPPRLDAVRAFGDAVHAAATGGRRWMFGRGSA